MTSLFRLAAIGCLLTSTVAIAPANAQNCAGNRNMCDALMHLQAARESVQRADSNKGGNRVQALRSIDRAIEQVRAGIRYSQGR